MWMKSVSPCLLSFWVKSLQGTLNGCTCPNLQVRKKVQVCQLIITVNIEVQSIMNAYLSKTHAGLELQWSFQKIWCFYLSKWILRLQPKYSCCRSWLFFWWTSLVRIMFKLCFVLIIFISPSKLTGHDSSAEGTTESPHGEHGDYKRPDDGGSLSRRQLFIPGVPAAVDKALDELHTQPWWKYISVSPLILLHKLTLDALHLTGEGELRPVMW